MKKRPIIIISLFLLFLLIIVQGEEKTPTEKLPPSEIDYSKPESVNDALSAGKSVDWDKVTDQGIISPENVPNIPADKLKFDQLNAQQRARITAKQLAYENNLANAGDLSQYPNAGDAIRQKYGNNINVEVAEGMIIGEDGVLSFGGNDVDLKSFQNTKTIVEVSGGVQFPYFETISL